jgi:crossover junction endodeoxyribonuclease RusA
MRLHTLPGGGTAARYPAAVYQWRGQVQQAVAQLEAEPFHGPVELHLAFDLPRPSGHFGTGRNAGTIKPSSPTWPIVAPDLDKLVRAVMDSVTDAGLWRDDSQVVAIHATKCYVTTPPGVTITVADIGRLTDEVLPFTPTVT